MGSFSLTLPFSHTRTLRARARALAHTHAHTRTQPCRIPTQAIRQTAAGGEVVGSSRWKCRKVKIFHTFYSNTFKARFVFVPVEEEEEDF